jgi:hypothetical protein
MFLPSELHSVARGISNRAISYKDYCFFQWYHFKIRPPEKWYLEFLIEEGRWDRCHQVNYDRMYLGLERR